MLLHREPNSEPSSPPSQRVLRASGDQVNVLLVQECLRFDWLSIWSGGRIPGGAASGIQLVKSPQRNRLDWDGRPSPTNPADLSGWSPSGGSQSRARISRSAERRLTLTLTLTLVLTLTLLDGTFQHGFLFKFPKEVPEEAPTLHNCMTSPWRSPWRSPGLLQMVDPPELRFFLSRQFPCRESTELQEQQRDLFPLENVTDRNLQKAVQSCLVR